MHFKVLTTPWQRSLGAMFNKELDTPLVFAYPHPAPRLFHTAFCVPLRILALDEQGQILFDQIAQPWQWVRLPATRLVVELDPSTVVAPADLQSLAQYSLKKPQVEVGTWSREATLDKLFFALLNEAVADIRRVNEANQRAKTLSADLLFRTFKPWERGQILGSAALVLEGADHVTMPENAVRLSHQIIALEKRTFIEELLAASLAGAPWEFPHVCFKCQYPAFWRPILPSPVQMPEELAWRYARPENHIPVCKRCAYLINWKSPDIRRELGFMIWGVRFEAILAWNDNWENWTGTWDLSEYPLWPDTCGGSTWAMGSGALIHATPREPEGVYRRAEHHTLLKKYFQRKPIPRPLLPSPHLNGVS